MLTEFWGIGALERLFEQGEGKFGYRPVGTWIQQFRAYKMRTVRFVIMSIAKVQHKVNNKAKEKSDKFHLRSHHLRQGLCYMLAKRQTLVAGNIYINYLNMYRGKEKNAHFR